MRLSPDIGHIGEGGAVVRAGRMPLARRFLPDGGIDGDERRIAFGPDMNLRDVQAVGELDPFRVDFGTADHCDLSGETPQRIAGGNRARRRR